MNLIIYKHFTNKVTIEGPTFTHSSSQMNLLSDSIKFMTYTVKLQRNVGDPKGIRLNQREFW